MIGAARHQDLALLGGGARDHDAERRGVGTVALEHRPVGMRHHADQFLGKLDETLRRSGQHVAQRALRGGGFLDLAVAVAQHHRAVGAHEVDIGVAVDVPQGGAFGAREELRIARRQARHVEVAVHAAGNDLPGTCPQSGIVGERIGKHGVNSLAMGDLGDGRGLV